MRPRSLICDIANSHSAHAELGRDLLLKTPGCELLFDIFHVILCQFGVWAMLAMRVAGSLAADIADFWIRVKVLKVRPQSPGFNGTHRYLGDSESCGQFPTVNSCVEQLPDFNYIRLFQYGRWMAFAENKLWMTLQSMSSLTGHVLHVVLVTPEEEVFCVRARREIARMANQQLSRINAVMQKICDAVDSVGQSSVKVHQAVACFVFGSGPRPTVIRTALGHARPKESNLLGGKLGNWFMIVSSHVISFVDRLVRAGLGVYALNRLAHSILLQTSLSLEVC